MTPEDLQTALARALATAEAGLVAPGFAAHIDASAPSRSEFGDWSTPVALRAAAAPERRTELAAHLCTELRTFPEVADAVIAGPGFVNVTLTPAARARVAFDLVAAVAAGGASSGRSPFGALLAAPGTEEAHAFDRPCLHEEGDAHVDPAAVHVLQRGHAAACREQRRAHRAGISTDDAEASRLEHPVEARMLISVAAVPSSLELAGRLGEIGPFLTALLELGEAVEEFLDRCVVTPTVDEDITVTHSSRLLALRAVTIVLAAGLRQLGASAPERI
ncbi:MULTISPECIES: DALR anticodon-binding domain-containing protein [unclassified Brevibacterium]|uniref:DALR anticodon-binding domain-containing protein n=1 Tax=unclassified Brevibacterium TaxID=2614124 RepID=UPI00143DEFD5|nr:DALR anticodon-binding domain-containing protein [Brevibacterium sp. S22]